MADATAPKLGAVTDLFKSERGLLSVLVLVGATVFVVLGHMTIEQWLELVKWLLVVYIGGKTITSAVETYTEGRKVTSVADASALASREVIASPAPSAPVAPPVVVVPVAPVSEVPK